MSALTNWFRTAGSPLTRRAVILIVVLAAVLTALAFKTQLSLLFRSGDTIHATFGQNYGLVSGKTKVKIAGLQVGVVSDVQQDADGTTHVDMKVDDGVKERLGSTPSARVEPLTVLGGEYALNLVPGGAGEYVDKAIPKSRTHVPVELDAILSALPSKTRKNLQGTIKEAGATLGDKNQKSIRSFARQAPRVLDPSTKLVTAVQGTRPQIDLPQLVGNLESIAAALNEQDAALARSLVNLNTTTTTLADHSNDLSATVARLPTALDETKAATDQLIPTLRQLDRTATGLQPTAERVGPLVRTLEPTLVDARPVAAKLPGLLEDAQPLVQDLVPTARTTKPILKDIKGPVIDRVDGPVLESLGSTYRGKGPFKDTGGGVQADNKFYQELAYMVTNLDRASMTQDAQGSLLNFQAGVSAGSVAPLNLDDALAQLIPQLKGSD
ncbi:MlaD family protein [Nocardioides sp. NBC_00163]|uniref:MlaD family protein n=1 Tax=Nocardioides sp. NBC_00163 TaxID=2975999 RepID=UPI003249A227